MADNKPGAKPVPAFGAAKAADDRDDQRSESKVAAADEGENEGDEEAVDPLDETPPEPNEGVEDEPEAGPPEAASTGANMMNTEGLTPAQRGRVEGTVLDGANGAAVRGVPATEEVPEGLIEERAAAHAARLERAQAADDAALAAQSRAEKEAAEQREADKKEADQFRAAQQKKATAAKR